jgi:outer membrane lipoprotein-sorting protein
VRLSIVGLACLGLLLVGANAYAGASNASEILKRGQSTIRGESTQVVMEMSVVRPDYSRNLKIRAWTYGQSNALVEILDPAKEEGVVSLRTDNQMWNYLPKTDQVVRVPSSLMLQSWMGSDFTIDDLMKASSLVRDYTHKIVREEKIGGERTVLIECKPKPDAPVVWGKIQHWARKSDNLPVQEKYFDEKNQLVRTLRFGKFRKMDDRVIPTVIEVRRAEAPKEYTRVVYRKVVYDRRIGSSLFNRDTIQQTSQQGKDLAALWSHEELPSYRKQAPARARTVAARRVSK